VKPSYNVSEKIQPIRLQSRLSKWENVWQGQAWKWYILYLCTETGILFTRIVSYIHSESNNSFSSSNHIRSITFFRDFDTCFNISQEFLTSTTGKSRAHHKWNYSINSKPVQLFTCQLSNVSYITGWQRKAKSLRIFFFHEHFKYHSSCI
jgi:hypothetical protein